MIKMIVSDLDDTLLRDDKSVSAYTKDILRRCREEGIKTAYATGRGSSAERLAPSELFDGKITQNGAAAVAGGNTVYQRLIAPCVFRPFLLACDKRGLLVAAQSDGLHYANFTVSDVWPETTNFRITDFAVHNRDAELLYATRLSAKDIGFIKSHLPKELNLIIMRDGLAQIMHAEATKAKAALALARLWGIEPSEIAAFGDDLNDVDLLKSAGTGVAMANALDEVKAVADTICLSNNEDGLARWIEENVLKKTYNKTSPLQEAGTPGEARNAPIIAKINSVNLESEF